MSTVRMLPSGRFQAQIRRVQIGSKNESKTFDSREAAEDWALRRESELLIAHHRAAPGVTAQKTFADAVSEYLDSVKFTNKAASTQARERTSAKATVAFLGKYALSVINRKLIQQYFQTRSKQKPLAGTGKVTPGAVVSGHTVRLDKAFLSSVFKNAQNDDLVTVNVMLDSFDLPQCHAREGRIEVGQQLKLVETANRFAMRNRTNKSLLTNDSKALLPPGASAFSLLPNL